MKFHRFKQPKLCMKILKRPNACSHVELALMTSSSKLHQNLFVSMFLNPKFNAMKNVFTRPTYNISEHSEGWISGGIIRPHPNRKSIKFRNFPRL